MDSEQMPIAEAPEAEAKPAAAEPIKPWPLHGYAPGTYMGQCVHCTEKFEGDKRALSCLPCAVVATKAAIAKLEAAAPSPARDDLKTFTIILDTGQRSFRASRMSREEDWIVLWNGARQIAHFFRPMAAGEQ